MNVSKLAVMISTACAVCFSSCEAAFAAVSSGGSPNDGGCSGGWGAAALLACLAVCYLSERKK
ncbi:MAG: hypothetical protein Q4F74_07715 [Synergistaceae bacterium]|nr:hypothetical protein [Synergistaceae bacterium]